MQKLAQQALSDKFFCSLTETLRKRKNWTQTKTSIIFPKLLTRGSWNQDKSQGRERKKLQNLYRRLNPAELKRKIEDKTHKLYRAYEEKKRGREAIPTRKQTPGSVRNYMI